MRLTGIIMVAMGAILLFLMILPFFDHLIIPRSGLPWTFTWAAVLGLFFFGAGFALIVTSGEEKKNKDEAI